MIEVRDKRVAVLGLGPEGQAAARLLVQQGATVVVSEAADSPAARRAAAELRALGVTVELAATKPGSGRFDLALLASGTEANHRLLEPLARAGCPVLSELEFAAQGSQCLAIAVAGSNGKRTTVGLIDRILGAAQRKTAVAGGDGLPFSALVERTRELDFLTVGVAPWQLERTEFFRPIVAVILNATPVADEGFATHDDYLRVLARVVARQQAFDWTIIQREALAQLRTLDLPVPGKTITFSAHDQQADIFLDRSLLISQLGDWAGPLLDFSKGQLLGSHHAENVMAALAVGRVLRVPLERMVEVIRACPPLPGRCEPIGAAGGVRFYNDAGARTPAATHRAILAMPVGQPGEANVVLIAGGDVPGADVHDLGPLLARRVKRAILLGKAGERLRAAWSLFTPCTLAGSVLEAVSVAAESAAPGDVVLLSPACSSRDPSPDNENADGVFRAAVRRLGRSMAGSGTGEPLLPCAGQSTSRLASGDAREAHHDLQQRPANGAAGSESAAASFIRIKP